jgi:hypothetical protein
MLTRKKKVQNTNTAIKFPWIKKQVQQEVKTPKSTLIILDILPS